MLSNEAERGGYADLLRRQTTLARFGELALRSNNRACRLIWRSLLFVVIVLFECVRLPIKHIRDITILGSFGWITYPHGTLPMELGSLPQVCGGRLMLERGCPIQASW